METKSPTSAGHEFIFGRQEGKPPVEARVVAISWKQAQFAKIYICGSSGVVYDEKDYAPLKKTATSVYLMGDHFEKMHRENLLAMGAADPAYAFFEDEAKKFVKEFVGEQEADDAAAEIGRLKVEGIYPYQGEPEDEVTKAERDVFDVLAVEVNRAVPQLKAAGRETKKLTYRLIREAVNTNPASIKTILTEVFNLWEWLDYITAPLFSQHPKRSGLRLYCLEHKKRRFHRNHSVKSALLVLL